MPALSSLLTQEQAASGLASLSVGLVYDQTLLWTQSFGIANLEQNVLATPYTLYGIGSVTKPFTATAILQLRDADKLALDDPISSYLPELRVQSRFPDTSPLTFRQILSHRAGLPFNAPVEPVNHQGVIVYLYPLGTSSPRVVCSWHLVPRSCMQLAPRPQSDRAPRPPLNGDKGTAQHSLFL